jgi:hypothetical protein
VAYTVPPPVSVGAGGVGMVAEADAEGAPSTADTV